MTDLIPREAALKIYTDWTLGPEEAIAKLRAIPAIDPAAIREAALIEAAELMNVRGRFTIKDRVDAILALIGEKK